MTTTDEALRHAGEALDASQGAEYVNVRRDVLDLLVRWIRVVRPVQSVDPGDFHHWQDIIDAAMARRDEV